jgi:hypothetical protein
MTIAFAVGAAVLAVACAVGHSLISERVLLGPLYAESCMGLLASRATRDIIRVIFHIPSIVWAVLGIAVVAARIQGGNTLISIVAAIIFTASGLGNLAALRSPHLGGLLLLGAAAFTLADLMFSGANRSLP